MDTIEDYLHVDPMSLLPEDCGLMDIDFEKLFESTPVDQETRAAEMATAVSAAAHVRNGSRQALHSRFCTGSNPRASIVEEAAVVDNEGSIQWRRRRRSI